MDQSQQGMFEYNSQSQNERERADNEPATFRKLNKADKENLMSDRRRQGVFSDQIDILEHMGSILAYDNEVEDKYQAMQQELESLKKKEQEAILEQQKQQQYPYLYT